MDIYVSYHMNMNVLKSKSKYLTSPGPPINHIPEKKEKKRRKQKKKEIINQKYCCPLCGQYKYWCICNLNLVGI